MQTLTLKRLADKALASPKPCRVMIEPMGIRINMWLRTDDGLFADYNHMIGWIELDYLDERNNADIIFEHLNFMIDQKIIKQRGQREAQNDGS